MRSRTRRRKLRTSTSEVSGVTQKILFLTRLHDDADRAEFERFVQEVELPLVATMSSVRRYVVVRLEGLVEEENKPMLAYDYADVVETTSVDAYRDDLARLVANAAGKEFEARWSRFVAGWKSVFGEVVGETYGPAA